MRRSTILAALSLFAVVAPLASAQRTTPPRCPTARVDEGASCTHETLSCTWRGTHEGARDTSCRCERGQDDQLHWRCEAVGRVYSE
jgi:hypothetical protein